MQKTYVFIFLWIISTALHAAGVVGSGLMVAPTKLVFKEGKSTSASLTLINNGKEAATYRIRSIYKKMNTNGSFTEIDIKDAQNALGRKLRFSPRQVTIQPGQSQKVRVTLRSTGVLKGQEFSTRMLFTATPLVEEKPSEDKPQDKDKFSIKLTALFGVSIPVLYWPEGIQSKVTYNNVSSEMIENTLNVSFDMQLIGNKSSYQNVEVRWQNPDGQTVEVGSVKGLYMYYPQTERHVTLKFTNPSIDPKGTALVTLTPKPD